MIDSTRGVQGGVTVAFKVPHSEGLNLLEGGTGQLLVDALRASPYRGVELAPMRTATPVRDFVAAQPRAQLFISTVALAGIRFGIDALADPIRRAKLGNWLLHRVHPMLEHRVLEVSEDVMFRWRLRVEDGRRA